MVDPLGQMETIFTNECNNPDEKPARLLRKYDLLSPKSCSEIQHLMSFVSQRHFSNDHRERQSHHHEHLSSARLGCRASMRKRAIRLSRYSLHDDAAAACGFDALALRRLFDADRNAGWDCASMMKQSRGDESCRCGHGGCGACVGSWDDGRRGWIRHGVAFLGLVVMSVGSLCVEDAWMVCLSLIDSWKAAGDVGKRYLCGR